MRRPRARLPVVARRPAAAAGGAAPPLRMAGDAGLALTPELGKLTSMFKAVPDAKLRYQQLLYFAKELAPMADELKTPANKVRRGCPPFFCDVAKGGEGRRGDRLLLFLAIQRHCSWSGCCGFR